MTGIVHARYPMGPDNDEVSASGTSPVEPCTLVSKGQAAAILGGGVQVTEAPQGPTCIFTAAGREVTLAVEGTALASLRESARHATRVRVAGQTGWCLSYGSTSVATPLDSGRVLQVTGPCPAGVRFAALALRRLPS